MKVLFAVSNEEISQSIVKKYQKQYKQIISYKNVYYFNAILKEIQKDKSYDRIVISEDLEAFTHTQYEQIDKFIFEKLDSISDEASDSRGNDTPIILICSDRRSKSEEILVKLFGIGVYNAIIGNDRSVDEVCKLINRPRSKKEAKEYYQIDSEDVSYQAENENDVSEMEIQNIVAHYKRLGKNEERFVDSFNNIAAQYNDTQLRIISKFLPLNVRAVLEEQSPKYQQIMSFNNSVSNSLRKAKDDKYDNGPSTMLLKPKTKDSVMSKPVIIPSAVNINSARKLSRTKEPVQSQVIQQVQAHSEPIQQVESILPGFDEIENLIPEQPIMEEKNIETTPAVVPPKRGRGRPRKNAVQPETAAVPTQPKRGRGRPKKHIEPVVQEPIEQIQPETTGMLPGFEDESNNTILPGFEKEPEDTILPGFENNYQEATLPGLENNYQEAILPGFEEGQKESKLPEFERIYSEPVISNRNISSQEYISTVDISSLLTPDKKIASFVGTSKNGTSFIVNNIAELMSSIGVNTAILDTTKNRNSYYIYTKNEEQLRQIASKSIEGLANGVATGIPVNKNLTVYTSLPDENEAINNVDKVLETLVKNYSLVLIDTDFSTPIGYFKQSQETYLVQTLDILTIQPLTAFLRELKAKNILSEEKLKIVLNKTIKIRGITEKTIIGGMAFYNDPSMSFMTELFDRNMIKYFSIPFEEETYIKYLENIINCDITLKGYSKNFMQTLRELGNSIYPITAGKTTYRPPTSGYGNSGSFTPSINSTLDQMKRNY